HFMPDERFRHNYVPLFNVLGGDKGPLVFEGEGKQRFLEEVLPKLSGSMEIEVPEELKERYVKYDLESVIYFDKYRDGIKADLRFKYGEYEFGCFENPKTNFIILVRDKEAEESVMATLEDYGFEARSTFYYLKNEASIYEFVTGSRSALEEKATLLYSEDFKKIKVRSGGAFNINLSVRSGLDMLEMSFGMEGMSSDELKDLFRSLRVKKKYYRLEDGSFINLLDEDMQKLSEVLDNLGISPKNIGENSVTLSKHSAFYLQDAFSGSNFRVDKNADFEELIEKISGSTNEEYEIPEGIEAELRAYQEVGFRWLRTLSENSLGGILADDMGLGKTLQSIVYMKSYAGSGNTFLIVCPSSIIYNWLDEIENFSPTLKALVVTGTPEVRAELIGSYKDYDVLITSYPLMRRDVSHYKSIKFHTVFLDEAQFIKNAASQNALSVKQLITEHRFALTGTPIENSLSELWSIFDFIMPGFLLSHSKFANRYEKPALKGDESVRAALNRRIRPFVLRRMKKDVLKDLPGKVEEKMITELTEEQKKVYMSYMNNVRSDLFSEIDREGIEKSRMKILAALTRLRQICCHPSTFLDNYDGGSGKLDLLLELIDGALANGHRILIFSQFTSMLEIIADELRKKELEFFYLEGATALSDRMDYVKSFNAGERQLFLISLKAGGTGLNLVGADTVIHYDPWWNPAVEDQATDRAYRIGQTNSVYVLKLLTKGTIEEKIYKLQQRKKDLSDSVIQSKEVFVNKLTKEELMDIFSFD
ncbi:MAG: DEAD/DEAH box helicase, partial [Lachnospiraceae bacterium]|nr:DEAD/DEAH box helicase [Lachnospiraceae bacterium]